VPPVVSLSEDYKLVDSIDSLGVPSLLDCRSLTVAGPISFAGGVVLKGDVSFINPGTTPWQIAPGTYRDQTLSP
jgi:UTP--glucose-1-phosphate uridylyltransferase/phosphoglucomutase